MQSYHGQHMDWVKASRAREMGLLGAGRLAAQMVEVEQQALEPGSRDNYANAWKHWRVFCEEHELHEYRGVTVLQLKTFLLWLFNLGKVAPSSMLQYLSGVKYYLAEAGYGAVRAAGG